MRSIKIGKARRKRKITPKKATRVKQVIYEKQPIVLKNCGNPNCTNTFFGTPNGKQVFCGRNCLRKIRGRKS